MSLSFSRYVRFIFHASPVLSLRLSSLHLPSCRLVALSFVSLSFPLHPLVFISVPFMSLSVPLCFPFISRCFPVMSTSYFLPSFPCTSLHFPFPLCSPAFPAKKHCFFQRFQGRPKTQSFSRFSAKGERAGRGIRAWDPCLATPDHPPPPTPVPYVSDVGRGGGCRVRGGVILYPLLGVRHAEQCRRTSQGTVGSLISSLGIFALCPEPLDILNKS